ncbi:MAG: hypothetical protein ACLFTK_07420, partial [Anaerolineales bacterium]
RPTATQTPTPTTTDLPSDTPSPSSSPTASYTPTHTVTPTVTATATPTETATATLTPTPTATPTQTATATPTQTATPIQVISAPPADTPSVTVPSPWLGLGALSVLVFGVYLSVYAVNAAALERYAPGFVIRHCPVCQAGQLELDERPYRVLGIPRIRRTVRCDNCRSVLREVGRRRWRYAIDRYASPELFEAYNGHILTEADLAALGAQTDDAQAVAYIPEDE